MERILEGVSKFQREVYPQHRELFDQLAEAQKPDVLFITCADSRIVPSMMTQTLPGDLFICRNAGNMVPPYGEVHGGVSATIEYAVAALGVHHIIVCGHSSCGAMKAVLHPEAVRDLPTVKTWLGHGEVARRIVRDNYPDLSEEESLRLVTEENVVAQLAHLRTHPSVASGMAAGKLMIHGWVYEIRSGDVRIWDESVQQFVAVEQYSVPQPATRGRKPRRSEEAA